MEELISVIIPAYNREETIISCVESVRKQSYNNIEIIIVDDGSTDETWKLFVNYPDKRVKYYKYNENKGACYARNYGVSLSSGLYIAFQDSDDIWFQNKLELEIDSLKKGSAILSSVE